MSEKSYKVSPIGQVESGSEGFARRIAALQGLDGSSHINVLWWSHSLGSAEHRNVMEAEQPYQNGAGIGRSGMKTRQNSIGKQSLSTRVKSNFSPL